MIIVTVVDVYTRGMQVDMSCDIRAKVPDAITADEKRARVCYKLSPDMQSDRVFLFFTMPYRNDIR